MDIIAPDETLADMGLEEVAAASEAMSEEEFQGAVKAAISDAADYIDDEVAPDREKAIKYYRADPFGNEEEGRSQVVMTEVRDTILAMMPSLLRVFTASEKPVEFAPRRAEDVAMAEQATDYVSYVFNVDNPGFTVLHSAFKNALLTKIGVFKWYTETKVNVREESYSGIDQSQLQLLQQDGSIDLLVVQQTGEGDPDPMTGMPSPLFSATIRRRTEDRRQVVQCVPPEEFLIARNARDLDTADYIGHRSLKTLSELVEMGYSREEIEEHGNSSSSFELNLEAQTRNPALRDWMGGANDTSADPSMRRYEYVESYIRIDRDGDGVAELRRVCTIGEASYILHDEVVDEVQMAVICPDPEPHMVIGSSIADQVMDLQLIKSNVVRNTLDSLAQVIHPRTVVVEGAVNMDDVLNVETGGIIRATQPGMIQELGNTFVGQQAMPIIAYLDDVRASRTGMSKASQGLDADVLQSTTKAAVTATMSAAQERLEMVARIFAETGIRRLFRGLLKEVIKHQDRPRMVRLRNQWVPVDPRSWDADMDVVVNVGLGTGSIEQRVGLLTTVVGQQKEILQTLGPSNPIVSIKQLRNTMAQILELSGLKDASRYFSEITPEAEQQMAQPQGQQQQDPAQLLAQVEAEKIKADIAIAQMKAQLEVEKQRKADDLERDKLDADIWLRATEMQMKYGTQVQVEQLYAMIQRERDAAKIAAQQQAAAMRAQQQPMGVQ
ncbi:MAG: hypothetical protein RLZZ09_471 [Pseudomonadota bacterium]|jgi:hypothetical protein